MIGFLCGLALGLCLGYGLVRHGHREERRKNTLALLAYATANEQLFAILKSAKWYAVHEKQAEPPIQWPGVTH